MLKQNPGGFQSDPEASWKGLGDYVGPELAFEKHRLAPSPMEAGWEGGTDSSRWAASFWVGARQCETP